MTILSFSRQHPGKPVLTGYLAMLFMIQAMLLPWFTAPKLVVSGSGQFTILCTLQGLQRVNIKTGTPTTPLNSTSAHCPACTLAHVVSVPLPVINLSVQFSPLLASDHNAYEEHAGFSLTQHAYAIRAPPLT